MRHDGRYGVFSALVPRIGESKLSLVLAVVLLFLLINFNEKLGIIFSFMLIADLFILKENGSLSFPIEKDDVRGIDFVLAIMAYAGFILLSTLISGVFQGQAALATPLNSVFERLAAATPILENSKFLTVIGWGFLIPIIETRFFFGRLYELVINAFHLDNSFYSPAAWVAALFVSATFAFFHLTSKSVSGAIIDNTALMLTFLFGMISMALVIFTRELAAAVYLHITNNTIASLINLKVKFIGSVLGVNV